MRKTPNAVIVGGLMAWAWIVLQPGVFIPAHWTAPTLDYWGWQQALLLLLGMVGAGIACGVANKGLWPLSIGAFAMLPSVFAWTFRTPAPTIDVIASVTAALVLVFLIEGAEARILLGALAGLWFLNVFVCLLDALGYPLHAWAWFYPSRQGSPYGIAGIGTNPNLSAIIALAGAPLAIAALPRRSWGGIGIVLITGWQLYALHSFTAIVGAAAVLIVADVATTPALFRLPSWSLLAALILATVFVLGVHRPDAQRFQAWKIALKGPLATLRTTILGYGPASFPSIGFGRTDTVVGGQVFRTSWESAHNDHVQVWFETGLIGTAAWAWLCGTTLWRGWKARGDRLGLAVLLATVGWLVCAGGSFPMRVSSTAAMGLGIVVLTTKLLSSEGDEPIQWARPMNTYGVATYKA